MSPTVINLINTLYSFYSHNWQLVWFGFFSLCCFIKLIFRPQRFYVLLLLGFLALLFEFEYSKHLIPHMRENVTELVLVDPNRRSFGFAEMFFNKLLPIGTQVFGWFLIFISIFFLPKDQQKGRGED